MARSLCEVGGAYSKQENGYSRRGGILGSESIRSVSETDARTQGLAGAQGRPYKQYEGAQVKRQEPGCAELFLGYYELKWTFTKEKATKRGYLQK